LLFRPGGIFTYHFLQKNKISLRGTDCVAKPVLNKPPVAPGETFMNIDRYYAQFQHADPIVIYVRFFARIEETALSCDSDL
jgi:hypothetical protein